MESVVFSNNVATIYGNDIASVSKKLVKITKSQLNATSLASKNALRYLQETGMQSGGKVSMYFALIDKYSTIVRTDVQSKLYIR
jgi:aminopeptidase C